jgi:prevent-host-death family protein
MQPRLTVDHGHDHGHASPVDTVSKSALKARMLEYFRRVEETGHELIVTDNGEPVLKVVPIRRLRPASDVFADVRGRVVYHEDVLTPTTDEWPET